MMSVASHLKKERGILNKDFYLSIGFERANLGKIKDGNISFTVEQMHNCIKNYGINPAYFFIRTAPMFN